MLGTQHLFLYIGSSVLLNLTPGQDTFYILGRSIAQGTRAGIISVAGIMTGVLVHTSLAALGLSAVLAASALAFNMVKYVGALYLIWIGIGLLRTGRQEENAVYGQPFRQTPWSIYRQGLLTNVLNPKVALFFLSFLPQFVDPNTEYTFIPFVLLGMIFFTTGSIWCLILACCSAWVTDRFRQRSSMADRLKKVTGALFVGLGVKLALTRNG